MAYRSNSTDRRGRIAALVAAGTINLGIVLGLIYGLNANVVSETVQAISAFNVSVPPPPPPPPPPPAPTPTAKAPEPAAAAAPPAPKAKPKEIVAPKPPLPIKRDTVKAPPVASSGDANRAGTANAGTGTGASGQGSGTGAGGSGSGTGGGARKAEKVSGEIQPRDYPAATRDARIGKFVVISYLVGTDGRVSDCRVVQPSGIPEADAITCRLAVQRHRYRPALNAAGQPVAVRLGWKQWWYR